MDPDTAKELLHQIKVFDNDADMTAAVLYGKGKFDLDHYLTLLVDWNQGVRTNSLLEPTPVQNSFVIKK